MFFVISIPYQCYRKTLVQAKYRKYTRGLMVFIVFLGKLYNMGKILQYVQVQECLSMYFYSMYKHGLLTIKYKKFTRQKSLLFTFCWMRLKRLIFFHCNGYVLFLLSLFFPPVWICVTGIYETELKQFNLIFSLPLWIQ